MTGPTTSVQVALARQVRIINNSKSAIAEARPEKAVRELDAAHLAMAQPTPSRKRGADEDSTQTMSTGRSNTTNRKSKRRKTSKVPSFSQENVEPIEEREPSPEKQPSRSRRHSVGSSPHKMDLNMWDVPPSSPSGPKSSSKEISQAPDDPKGHNDTATFGEEQAFEQDSAQIYMLPPPGRSSSHKQPDDHTKEQSKIASSELNLSDEFTIGLPKEQYKPRPSRSRSSRNHSEVDAASSLNSVKPVNKEAMQENKVTANIASDVQQLVDMGFEQTSAEQALQDAQGSLQAAMELLLEAGSNQLPQERKVIPKTNVEMHFDEATTSNVDDTTSANETDRDARDGSQPPHDIAINHGSDDELAPSPAITTSRARARTRKKHTQTPSPSPPASPIEDVASEPLNTTTTFKAVEIPYKEHTPAPKKKGRGRPKKQPDAEADSIIEVAEADTIELKPVESEAEPELEPEPVTSVLSEVPIPNGINSTANRIESTTSGKTNPATKSNPSTPNSRPIHRVGLSRRMRIEPLLKRAMPKR